MTTRARSGAGDEAGFSLVEAVVALFVLGIIFTALAGASISALRASMTARVEQQALDFATERLEEARALDYYSLAHVTADLSGDPRLSTCSGGPCLDPGTGLQEPVVVDPAGAVAPHISAVNLQLSNNVPITIATYVTRPPDTNADYKRVTVIASWTLGSVARERVMSSLVTVTTRGLPLPLFKLTPLGATSASVNPDSEVPFALELSNQGAPDRWNLTFSGSAFSHWGLFRDDGDGVWETSAVDAPLVNTNPETDSMVDTGRIDPTGSIVLWAVRDIDDHASAGDYWTTLTATSAAQASAATGTASVDLMVRVVASGTPVTGDPGGGQLSTVPGAPVNLLITTGNTSLVANWGAPASQGSSAITDYVISFKRSVDEAWTTFDDGVSAGLTVTVTGLTNATTYDIAVAARNTAGVGAQASAQGMPEAPYSYTAPVKCPATELAPSANNGYTLRTYALHNRSAANPTWPGPGIPAATSTIGQGLPLSAAVDGAQVPSMTDLPVYSSDILSTKPGRIVVAGGSLTSNDTTRVVDWRATTGSKSYKGSAVLALWVAPVTSDEAALPWSVLAQPYYRKSDGTLASLAGAVTAAGAANSFGASGCLGWQQVFLRWSVNQASSLGANEYIGVRLWVPTVTDSMARLRLAYDVVGDFPAGFTVPEKP